MLKKSLKELASNCLDVVFPRQCIVTGKPLSRENPYRYLSEEALSGIEFIGSPNCIQCGMPFHGEASDSQICPNCIELDPDFDTGTSLFMLQSTGRTLIHELKYRDGYYLWHDLRKIIQSKPSYLEPLEGSILVPVPLHPRKLRKRGFNQSLSIAKILEEQSGATGVENLLIRTKSTQAQAHLSKEERRQNVKNAFALRPKTAINSALKYTIVDDVFTTGATLNACAKILKKQGAKQVNIITLGHG